MRAGVGVGWGGAGDEQGGPRGRERHVSRRIGGRTKTPCLSAAACLPAPSLPRAPLLLPAAIPLCPPPPPPHLSMSPPPPPPTPQHPAPFAPVCARPHPCTRQTAHAAGQPLRQHTPCPAWTRRGGGEMEVSGELRPCRVGLGGWVGGGAWPARCGRACWLPAAHRWPQPRYPAADVEALRPPSAPSPPSKSCRPPTQPKRLKPCPLTA